MNRYREEREAPFHIEHWLAWFMALGAVVLGLIGALVAFGVVSARTQEIATDPLAAPIGETVANFQDGMLFILPAIAAAFLALTLHMTDHHNRVAAVRERAVYNIEHAGAYLFAGIAILFGVLAILIGFDVFNRGNVVYDGYIWGFLAIGAGIITTTLHAVGHHQVAADEAYITRIVEERVGGARAAPGPVAREPGTEPRR
jgi:hypothetical protein